MYNSDKPIQSVNEDKLGRATFAKQLADAIYAFNSSDNFVISLCGKWGCGKTSILNMTFSSLKELSEKIICIRFNPWNFSDSNQLLNQFFVTLSNELKIKNLPEGASHLGEIMESYSSSLEYTEFIPIVGKYLKLLPLLAKDIGKKMKEDADEKLNDVSYRKREVEKALLALDRRILIVIDDIDRLPNDQIRAIFQLVNSVAGFPNVTYLLSFDKDVVVNALSDVQYGEGEEYLEKIIQIPFDIPEVNLQNVYSVLFDKLDEILDKSYSNDFDKTHWSDVFLYCIKPFINNLRDINRFINILYFKYNIIKNEIDFIDLAGITALQVFAPKIFRWIISNRSNLIGYHSDDSNMANIDKYKNEQTKILASVDKENPIRALNAISCLFPSYHNRVNYRSVDISTDELCRNLRIACERRFDLYFTISLDEIKIAHTDIIRSFSKMSKPDLYSFLKNIIDRDHIVDYILELQANLDQIPLDRIEIFIVTLYAICGYLPEKEVRSIDFTLAYRVSRIIIDLLFKYENEPRRSKILEALFKDISKQTLRIATLILSDIEYSHGRFSGRKYEKQVITLDHLLSAEKIYLFRFKKTLNDTSWLCMENAAHMIYLWENIEPDDCKAYFSKILEEDINIIRFISAIAQTFHTPRKDYSIGYQFKKDDYEQYVSAEKIMSSINEMRFNDTFWQLPTVSIEKVASFAYHQENPEIDDFEMKSEYIDQLINTWQQQYDDYIKVE